MAKRVGRASRPSSGGTEETGVTLDPLAVARPPAAGLIRGKRPACIARKILEIFRAIQALIEELLGLAEQFLCFFQKKNLRQRVSIQTLEYFLIIRREASDYEVSIPQ